MQIGVNKGKGIRISSNDEINSDCTRPLHQTNGQRRSSVAAGNGRDKRSAAPGRRCLGDGAKRDKLKRSHYGSVFSPFFTIHSDKKGTGFQSDQ